MEDSGEIKTDKKGVPATEEFTNETNHPKPSKRKFTLVAVTAIGLIGIAVGIVGIIIISMKNSETARLEQQIIEKDVIIAELQKAPTENDKDAAENGTSAINRNPLLHLDAGKCLNCYDTPPTWSIVDGLSGKPFAFPRGFNLTTDGSKVMGTISWDELSGIYSPYFKIEKTGIESIEINFSTKVNDIYASGFGQVIGYETLLFLMEDGTVEYIPVVKAMQEKMSQSCGKIPGVENIVKFYTTSGYGGVNLLGQRADGDYYNLSTILLDIGDYQY